MHSNKNEIEIFYKTHNLSAKEVAKHFNIPYRTINHWIKKESWIMGEALQNIKINPLSSAQSDKIIDITQAKIKNQIKQNLGALAYEVDDLILKNLLDSSTDDILLKTMTLNFIQKNMSLGAVIAKDALMKMISSPDLKVKDSPMVIACAEKVVKIFSEIQANIYGKNINLVSGDNKHQELESLSTSQLAQLIKELEES